MLLAVVGRAAAAAGGPSLVLAVAHGSVTLPVQVAQAQGYFESEGLSVTLVPCVSGRACVEAMRSGKADLATASELIVALDERRDLGILATFSASSHQIKLIARRSARVQSPADLAGKRIGTVAGTSAQYFLDSLLLYHGVDPARILPVNLPPAQLPQALAHQTLDAVAIWEPLASQAVRQLGPDALTLPSPRVYTQYFNLVAPQAVIDRRAADLKRVLLALLRAERYLAAHPEQAQQSLQRLLGVDAAEAEQVFREQDYRVRLDQALAATMSAQMRWAQGNGLLKGGAGSGPGEGLAPPRGVAPALLRQLAPNAVTVVD